MEKVMVLPFTEEALVKAISDGDVTQRWHPSLPYQILNYSPSTQYAKKWNDVTLNCRGLILDDDYNIIARPWKKFFNMGEIELPMQFTDPVEVMDKADGSLGILYPADDGYAIATRGSFESEQAKHATRVWNEKYSHLAPQPGYTFLFEIVYPANRIVLNYNDMDDLILLGAIENKTGYYLSPKQAQFMFHIPHAAWGWTGPVVKTFDYKNISEALGHMDRSNAEGYVIRSHNFMVKLKQPDYLILHRLVTNMTPKTIWEQLKSGKTVTQIVADLPDEFHSMAEDIANPLVDKFHSRLTDILDGFSHVKHQVVGKYGIAATRKEHALMFSKYSDKKYYFSLLDGRDIKESLWDELKPKEEVKNDND